MQVTMKSPNLNEFSRGARFLDLVKNNKLNVSPQLTKRLSLHGKNAIGLMERSDKKPERNDYLKFSNGTPNLKSSPASGILSKRKSTAIETPDSPSQHSAKVMNFNKICFKV